ncbi:hypothetical protein RHMOL_Rhmol08G0099600 [Rhododendron molle]|uniref:Uncharacterized protein n=1 Tax=Rhododendron molle TaxID=49168 RepID=A0ACC0MLJ9_RHOML|nr:hypothetical protein RHMOL_Rhmol08G0099600 [Rhododendron molle]
MAEQTSRQLLNIAAGVSELASTEQPPQPSTSKTLLQLFYVPEHFLWKNRLQEYAQRSGLPIPIYQTINEGAQRPPMFRSTVFVDGTYITSPNTFSNRKAAEQDVASVALASLTQKIKEEGYPIIRESLFPFPIIQDTVFCKSILNEYATKMNLEKPTYTTRSTIQPKGLLPVFISSLVFNGVNYSGEAGRNKKEAEQLAARAVILSIFGNSESGTAILEIIKSKFRLYAALHKLKASQSSQDGIPLALNTGNFVFPFRNEKEVESTRNGNASLVVNTGIPFGNGKEVGLTRGANNGTNITSTVISEACGSQIRNIPALQKPFQDSNTPLAPNTGTDFVFSFRNEKEVESTGNGNAPLVVKTGVPLGNGKEVGITQGANNGTSITSTVISEAYASQLGNIPAMQKPFQDGSTPLAPSTGTDFVFPFRNEKEVESTGNGNAPLMVNTEIPFGNGKEVGITRGANNVTSNVISEAFAKLSSILATQKPLHQCKRPKWEPSPVAFTPPAFVPPAMEQPLGVGPSSAKKRNRKNKKKRKKLQVVAQ